MKMRRIDYDERAQIRGVAERWAKQYKNAPPDSHQGQIRQKLNALDVETATAKDVAAIIGNPTWVCAQRCDECDGYPASIMQLGDEPDYDASTVWMCRGCLVKAIEVLDAQPLAPPTA